MTRLNMDVFLAISWSVALYLRAYNVLSYNTSEVRRSPHGPLHSPLIGEHLRDHLFRILGYLSVSYHPSTAPIP